MERLKQGKKQNELRVSLVTFTALAILALTGCSSSKPKESEMTDIVPASTDAGTDVVPASTPEGNVPSQPAPSADANTATPPAVGDAGTPPPSPTPAEEAPQPEKKSKRKHRGSYAASSTPSAPPQNLGPLSPGEYSVQRGDTLMKIAFETYGDVYHWKTILDANRDKISDPNNIPTGTVLKVDKPQTPVVIEKNGEKYQIQKGDTLGKISNHVYGTPSKWKRIWENNKQLIHDPNKIFAGFSLYYLPSDQGAVSPSVMGSNSTGAAKRAVAKSASPGPAVDPVGPAPAAAGGAAAGPNAIPALPANQ